LTFNHNKIHTKTKSKYEGGTRNEEFDAKRERQPRNILLLLKNCINKELSFNLAMESPSAFVSTNAFKSSSTSYIHAHIHKPLHAGIQLTASGNRNALSTITVRGPLEAGATGSQLHNFNYIGTGASRIPTSMFMSEKSNVDNGNDGDYGESEFDRRGILGDSGGVLGDGDIAGIDEDELFDEDALLEELLALNDNLGNHSHEPDFDELKELEQLLEQDLSDDWSNDDDNFDDDEQINDDDMLSINRNFEEDRLGKSGLDPSLLSSITDTKKDSVETPTTSSALEEALLRGVVPASAGVGSKCLPGDYGFDPLGLAKKDYFKNVQNFLINLLPEPADSSNEAGAALPLVTEPILADFEDRPAALILRDYREIEIRHGRLAMLAALLWPMQEIIDRLFIPDSFGSTTMIYGGITLPFITLFMTLVMLLLGYLDIYAASIKDQDTGEAFLPGECFWDPLSILAGAPEDMKQNMQARELNNGRFAMIAVLSYILQEGITHQPLILLPWNQVLFEPAFEIPAVQAWLDGQFAGPTVEDTSFIDAIFNEILESTDVDIS
jgi:light-harvesting complex I chlorophyll a/b binding protein 1